MNLIAGLLGCTHPIGLFFRVQRLDNSSLKMCVSGRVILPKTCSYNCIHVFALCIAFLLHHNYAHTIQIENIKVCVWNVEKILSGMNTEGTLHLVFSVFVLSASLFLPLFLLCHPRFSTSLTPFLPSSFCIVFHFSLPVSLSPSCCRRCGPEKASMRDCGR